jgi:hypothetical protein
MTMKVIINLLWSIIHGTILSMPNEFEIVEGEDYYYDEDGKMVFTEKYLLKRGHCCQSGCKHCPYGYQKE